jgi:hypothetical protein
MLHNAEPIWLWHLPRVAHLYREGGLRAVYYRKLIRNITNNIIIICIVIPKSLETVGAWF